MKIIPVIDLLNGVVVRGIAGQRDRYRPIRSNLALSPDPSVVLNAICQAFDLRDFYIADLDAIQHQQLNRCTIAELSQSDVSLMVDRGVRSEHDVEELLDLGVDRVIMALETLNHPDTAAQLLQRFGSQQLVLSLDLKNGQPLTNADCWGDESPLRIAQQLCEVGFRQFIVLDIAAVGVNQGIPTLPLCQEIHRTLPDVTIITGGGVRGVADLTDAQKTGVDSVLVASALHDGRLTKEDLEFLRTAGD